MRTRTYSIIAAIVAAAAMPAAAGAQSLEESVTVEGKYSPEIIKADRLPLLPDPATLTAPESRLEYDQKGVNANFAPDALPMTTTGWRATKKYNGSKGYLDLRLGSWLNSSLSAGVAAIDSPDTRLGITLQHNSTSLWRAWTDVQGLPDADKRFRYDERVNAALSHRIGDAGTLKADVQYHLGYFNYYGSTQNADSEGKIKAPTQTLNDLFAGARWTGSSSKSLTYAVRADVRHFAYRASYAPPTMWTLLYGKYGKGERETEINAGGSIVHALGKTSGLEAEVLYTGVLNSIADNVNRVRIKPAYTLTRDNLSLRIGMEMAVVGADKTRFRIAPDVRMTARAGLAAISAAVGGGTRLRTLAWMHNMDYYSNPLAGCTGAAYSPIDTRLGIQLNPSGKWTAGVEGSWQTTLDESLGGLYQAYLNGTAPATALPSRLHGISVAVNAGYDFSKEFKIHGKATWQPQHGTVGVLNGFDRPRYTAEITAGSQLTDKLRLQLSYNMRACRELVKGNISRLDLTADYMISDRISVGAELNNLLNRHESILPGLALEGFNAAGGVQIIF